MAISDIISAGVNNPECSFFVGYMSGQSASIGYLLVLLSIYAVFKLINKLLVDPFILWVKGKVQRGKK